MEVNNKAKNKFGILIEFIIILLALQFLVGIYVNLFVIIPPMTFPSGMMMMFSSGMPMVMLHMVVGIILGLLSIVIIFLSFNSGNKKVIYLSILALGFVIIAGFNGLEFLFNGQNNINSFFMATSFIIVIMSEFAMLLLVRSPNMKHIVHSVGKSL
jgi:hypothetical protein